MSEWVSVLSQRKGERESGWNGGRKISSVLCLPHQKSKALDCKQLFHIHRKLRKSGIHFQYNINKSLSV